MPAESSELQRSTAAAAKAGKKRWSPPVLEVLSVGAATGHGNHTLHDGGPKSAPSS